MGFSLTVTTEGRLNDLKNFLFFVDFEAGARTGARGEVDESEIGAEPVALDPIGSTEPAKQNMPCCASLSAMSAKGSCAAAAGEPARN